MENKEIKYEQCNDCLALEQGWQEECAKCKDGSGHITVYDLMSDFEKKQRAEARRKQSEIFSDSLVNSLDVEIS